MVDRNIVERMIFQDGANNPFYVSQPINFYEALTKTSKPMRKPTIPIETYAIPQEIPYFINPSLEMADYEPPAISVPIIAFLDPSKISDDKSDVPITAALPIRDDFLKSQLNYLENERDDIQRDVENYADKTSWNVQPYNRRLFSAPSEVRRLFAILKTFFSQDMFYFSFRKCKNLFRGIDWWQMVK